MLTWLHERSYDQMCDKGDRGDVVMMIHVSLLSQLLVTEIEVKIEPRKKGGVNP